VLIHPGVAATEECEYFRACFFVQVSFAVIEFSETALTASFLDVSLAVIPLVVGTLWDVLGAINCVNIDMTRIRNILNRKIVDVWGRLEADPHTALSYDLIGYMLYGKRPEDVRASKNLKKKSWSNQNWHGTEYLTTFQAMLCFQAVSSTIDVKTKNVLIKECGEFGGKAHTIS
jgi:hypothetical protein